MIDWLRVLRHALWIFGAAIAVATWSLGRAAGFGAAARAWFRGGALMFCIGLALVTPWWQSIVWAALALFAAYEVSRTFPWRQPHL
ncbi:MAG TPA: hypothetical protein VHU41_09355 [Thermoanaerobaculia bacterium]|jgi:hypothetical protein|nr:hypothetical protein [Thermoanaerobaculia bacterium]